jgi:hypothetical protein
MAGIMLVAFVSRALVPQGFMPASDRPFSIEICWEGLPAGFMPMDMSMDSMDMASMDMDPASAAHHHHGSPAHSEHCVFGTACSAGPISHLPPSDISSTRQRRALDFASIAVPVHVVYLPPPRAPPGRLS